MKNPLALEAKTVSFKLSENGGFAGGEYDVTADDLLSNTLKEAKKKAEHFALATAKRLEDEALKMTEPPPLMSAKSRSHRFWQNKGIF